jgi:hypothetical protein
MAGHREIDAEGRHPAGDMHSNFMAVSLSCLALLRECVNPHHCFAG